MLRLFYLTLATSLCIASCQQPTGSGRRYHKTGKSEAQPATPDKRISQPDDQNQTAPKKEETKKDTPAPKPAPAPAPKPAPAPAPAPKPAPAPTNTVDYKKALSKAGKSKGISNPVTWNHAKSHGLGAAYNGKARATDYADIWLAKVVSDAFRDLKTKFKVAKFSHMGIYNYRKIAGSSKLSRHSHALALDIGSFTLADGTTLNVLKDWKHATKGPLLKQIRNELCKSFHVVLSPDYNAAHKNHFHIDLDPARRKEEKAPFWNELSNFMLTLDYYGNEQVQWFDPEMEESYPEEALPHEGSDEGLSVMMQEANGKTCK